MNNLWHKIRNKQIIIKSSRFYEELKVFTWRTGRAEARRGFNDDLVMSLAIGAWLFDGSSDYSKNSKALNDAILGAFQIQKREYGETPDAVLKPVGVYENSSERKNSDKGNIVKQDINKTLNHGNIPADMLWLLK